MAGGKETPRQRLIGLMYLVLLALLAIQVSDSIMEKFFFLEQSLNTANGETVKRNKAQLSKIEATAKARDTDDAKKLAITASQVRKISEEMLKYIEEIKIKLVEETGGRDESHGGLYQGAKEDHAVAEMLIGPSSNGTGYELKKKLDAYYAELLKLAPSNFDKKQLQPLAYDGKDHPIFKENSDQNIKDYPNLTFGQTPLVAAMAVLAETQSRIANYESLILSSIDPEAATIKVDKISADYSAVSSVVAAGTDYEAKIFLTAKNKSLRPDVTFRGSKIAVDDEGYAPIKFKAAGGAYDKDGFAKATWTASVKVPTPAGGIEEQTVTGEYLVAKPTVEVKAAAVSALYENCGNELVIMVPSLGANYKPSFQCNAPLINGSQRGQVIVVPKTRADVTIGVSSSGTFIDKVTFKVRPVPLPAFSLKTPSGPVNDKTGIKSNTPYVNLEIKPDEGFATFLPKEANYTIGEMEVTLGRGKTAKSSQKITSNSIRLSSLNASSGDRLVIEIKKLYRTNFRGEKIEVPIPAAIATRSISIND